MVPAGLGGKYCRRLLKKTGLGPLLPSAFCLLLCSRSPPLGSAVAGEGEAGVGAGTGVPLVRVKLVGWEQRV